VGSASHRYIRLAKGNVSVDCSTDPEFADLAAFMKRSDLSGKRPSSQPQGRTSPHWIDPSHCNFLLICKVSLVVGLWRGLSLVRNLRNLGAVAIASLVIGLVVSGSSLAQEVEKRRQAKPTWGEFVDTKSWPWTAVGRVNMAGMAFCSGVLIAPRIALMFERPRPLGN